MAFFELPEGLGESAEAGRRAWCGPAGSVIGSPTPLQLLLATSDSAAVSVTRVTAHPDGFELNLDVNVRSGHLDVAYRHPAEAGQLFDGEILALTPGFLRFGIEWPDGGRATNLHDVGEMMQLLDNPEADAKPACDERVPPSTPVLRELGTICTPRTAHLTYWAWPLPAAGPLAFVVEWPSHEIPETRRYVDAEILIEAAERAITVWSEA